MQIGDEMLGRFCEDLRTMWQQAGGPSLRTLSRRVGLSKSQLGVILAGKVRRPPDWQVVRELVMAFHQHARAHDRLREISVRTGIDEYWRPRHALVEQASRSKSLPDPGRDPVPDQVPEPPPGSASARPVPRQLPPAVRGFTGREAELLELSKLLDQTAEGAGTVVISSINGMAGVGKTALAVRWAHQAAERFPDGALYVNLRGYHAELPMGADEALAGFLTALGVPDGEVPRDTDARSARYRTELAGRRMVMVLDNASSVEQVRPLLPGAGRFLVLVTSRDSLAGLVAVDGAERLTLDRLPPLEASALLRRLIGVRAELDPAAVDALAHHCARLPLALRICAELARSRPTTALADLADELSDQRRRLDLLDAGGDPQAAVTSVFSWSIRHLAPEAARAFRLLGLHPGPDADAHAVAALAGTGDGEAGRVLDLLARAHLVQPGSDGRVGMHDLLRSYALNLALAQESDTQRRSALDRLFDYYLAAAARAMDVLHPADARERPRLGAPGTPLPVLADAHAARCWLDSERPTLLAVAAHTAVHGWPSHTVRLAAILFRYLDLGHFIDGRTIFRHARRAARQAGDVAGEALGWRGLGNIDYRLSQYHSAGHHLRRALLLFRRVGTDPAAEARTLNGLGNVELELGRYDVAASYVREALVLFRRIGNRPGETMSLNVLGTVERHRGRYGLAVTHYTLALDLARQTGDWTSQALALDGLGQLERQRGRYGAAVGHHEQALALTRRLGHRHGEAHVLDNLGTALIHLNRPQDARRCLDQAMALFLELHDGSGRASALNGLGEAALAAADPASALRHFTDALAAATAIGKPMEQARARRGLAAFGYFA